MQRCCLYRQALNAADIVCPGPPPWLRGSAAYRSISFSLLQPSQGRVCRRAGCQNICVHTHTRSPLSSLPSQHSSFAPPALQRCSFSRSAQANFPRMLSFFFFFLPGGLWTRLSLAFSALAFGLKESALFYRSESHIFANIWFPKFATILFYNSYASFVDFKSWPRQLFQVE